MFEKEHHTGFENLSTKSDKELIALLYSDSRSAFSELYARYKGRLMYFCKRFLKDDATSEDLIQDVFIQLWETRNTLNKELSFSGYVHTLTQNRILNMFRKVDIHSRFVQNILTNRKETTNQTEDSIIDNDYAELLNRAIETLSPKQKDVFRLSRLQGLTYKEIAEILHISVDTVQEHASLALKKIRDYLIQHTDIHIKAIALLLLFS